MNDDLLNETIALDPFQNTTNVVRKLCCAMFNYPQASQANRKNMERGNLDSIHTYT